MDTLEKFSQENSIDMKLLKAVIAVEAGNSGFDLTSGALKIRFEVHLALDSNPNLSRWFKVGQPRYLEHFMRFPSFSNKWSSVHTGKQDDEFKALLIAAHTIGHEAWKYCSMGKFQIMGFHYAKLGFPSAIQMYSFMATSDENDTSVGLQFIKSNSGLINSLQQRDLRSFVAQYNGTAQIEHYLNRFNQELNKL